MHKKGFVCKVTDPKCASKIEQLHVAQYYNWNPEPAEDLNLPFYPMIWSLKDMSYLPKLSHYDTILGFNEPDKEEQSDISVKSARSAWKKMEKNTHFRLGSPATAGNPFSNNSWLRQFMKEKDGYTPRVDFITVHDYHPATLNGSVDKRVSHFMGLLDDLHELFGKPIWITEFGIAGSNSTKRQVMDLMENLMEEINKKDYIEQFYWKDQSRQDAKGVGNLFDSKGKLTDLGHLYSTL